MRVLGLIPLLLGVVLCTVTVLITAQRNPPWGYSAERVLVLWFCMLGPFLFFLGLWILLGHVPSLHGWI